jgi:hypothetical protein
VHPSPDLPPHTWGRGSRLRRWRRGAERSGGQRAADSRLCAAHGAWRRLQLPAQPLAHLPRRRRRRWRCAELATSRGAGDPATRGCRRWPGAACHCRETSSSMRPAVAGQLRVQARQQRTRTRRSCWLSGGEAQRVGRRWPAPWPGPGVRAGRSDRRGSSSQVSLPGVSGDVDGVAQEGPHAAGAPTVPDGPHGRGQWRTRRAPGTSERRAGRPVVPGPSSTSRRTSGGRCSGATSTSSACRARGRAGRSRPDACAATG